MHPNIFFSPFIGETNCVRVPASSDEFVTLHFTASFEREEDWEQLKRDGGSVEVWSDIPAIGSGRTKGQWGGLTFPDPPAVDFEPKEDAAIAINFSLLPDAHGSDLDNTNKIHVLHLVFSVLLSEVTGVQSGFSFTYRIVYPSGEIRWLGQFGLDGILVFDTTENAGLVLADGWERYHVGGSSQYVWNAGEDGEVARLIDQEEWAVWAVGRDGSVITDSPEVEDACLIFFVPRSSSDTLLLPRMFVLCASSNLPFSLHWNGSITAAGSGASGSLLLLTHMLNSDSQAMTSQISSHCTSLKFRFFPSSSSIVLLSPENIYPISALVIPLSPSLSPSSLSPSSYANLSLPLPLLPRIRFASKISLSTLSNNSTHTFDLSIPDISTSGTSETTVTCTFTLPATGSQFTLTPMYNLKGRDGDTSAVSEPEPEGLPTPPPSPRLRLQSTGSTPKAHPVVSDLEWRIPETATSFSSNGDPLMSMLLVSDSGGTYDYGETTETISEPDIDIPAKAIEPAPTPPPAAVEAQIEADADAPNDVNDGIADARSDTGDKAADAHSDAGDNAADAHSDTGDSTADVGSDAGDANVRAQARDLVVAGLLRYFLAAIAFFFRYLSDVLRAKNLVLGKDRTPLLHGREGEEVSQEGERKSADEDLAAREDEAYGGAPAETK